ncbi:spore coat putative kinase YutH [Fredinandcohnia humi]
MKKFLFDHYNLKIDRTVSLFGYQGIIYRNILYCIVPVANWEPEEIFEIKQMSDYMIQRGDIRVGSILPTTSGQLTCRLDQLDVVLVRCPVHSSRGHEQIGKELARFHKRGRSFPYQVSKVSRIGQWKYLWEQRVDQMELFWKEKVKSHPETRFEEMFIEAFPYYIGLTENAIQYLVDTELDEYPAPIDSATICHHRYTELTWDKQYFVKFPTDWVYDHFTRDLAEYIRDQYINGENQINDQIIRFMEEYERGNPLSPFSWRLLYARLLFPLHFFECVEGYYVTDSVEKKQKLEQRLASILKHSSENERFLASFFQNIGVDKRRAKVPGINWLSR